MNYSAIGIIVTFQLALTLSWKVNNRDIQIFDNLLVIYIYINNNIPIYTYTL